MKKFLSVLLAVMMVLSTVSFAIPSAVGTFDAAVESEAAEMPVAVPEETATLAADDTWYDLEKGTLLFNMDFDSDNNGNAVAATAYDGVSLGSYSAGAGELVSGLGRLNPDVAGNYDVGFRYTNASATTLGEEGGNKYLSLTSSGSNQISLYLGNTYTKTGKYVFEYKYKLVSTGTTTSNGITYNTLVPPTGGTVPFTFDTWVTETATFEVSSIPAYSRVMFYGKENYSTSDKLYLDDIKVWYYDESVDYDAICNPTIEINDVWEDEEKGTKLFTIDFTAKNDKKALTSASWDNIKERLDNNPTMGELVSDLGRINPDVDGSNYRISFNYIDNSKTELVNDNGNVYLSVAPDGTKGDVSLYLGGFYGEEGTYYIETSYKFLQTGSSSVDRIRYETLGIEYKDASYLSTGNWVDLSEAHEHASCSHANVNRTRFTTEGYNNEPFAADDRIYIDNIAVYFKAPESEEPDAPEEPSENEWFDTELGDILYEIDFEAKNDGSALTANDIASITNGRLDASGSAGVAVADIAKVNPAYSAYGFRVGIKDGGTVTLADGSLTSTTTGTPSFYFRNSYVGKGQYVFVFDYNVSCDASFYAHSGYTNGTVDKKELDSTWMRVTYVVEELNDDNYIAADTYASDYLRMIAHRASADGKFVFDNVKVYYKPEGWTPPSEEGGEEGGEGDEPAASEWIDAELGNKLFVIDLDNDTKYQTAALANLNNRIDGSNDDVASNGLYLADIGRTNPEYASYEGTFKYSFKDGLTPTVEGTTDKYFKHTTSANASVMVANPFVGEGTYTLVFNHSAGVDFGMHSGYKGGTLTKTAIDSTWEQTVYTVDISAQGSDDYFRMYSSTAPGTFLIDDVALYYRSPDFVPPVEKPEEPVVSEWANTAKGYRIFVADFETKNDGTAVISTDVSAITNSRVDSSPATAGIAATSAARVNPEYSSIARLNVKGGAGASIAGTADNQHLSLTSVGDSLILSQLYVGDGTYVIEFDANSSSIPEVRGSYSAGTVPTTQALDGTWTRYTFVSENVTEASSKSCSSYHTDNIRFYFGTAPSKYDNIVVYYQPTGWTAPGTEGGDDDEDDSTWTDAEKGDILYTIDFSTKNDGTAVTASDIASITSGRIDNNPTTAGLVVSNAGRVNPKYSSKAFRVNVKDAGTSSIDGTDNKYLTQTVGTTMSFYVGSFYVGEGRYTVEFDTNSSSGQEFVLHSGFTSGTLTKTAVDSTWTRYTYVFDATSDLSYIRFISSGPSNEGKFTFDNIKIYYKKTMADVTVKANGNANVSDTVVKVNAENGAKVGNIIAAVDRSMSTKKLLGASLTADGEVLAADYVVKPSEVNTIYLIWGEDIVVDSTPWYHEEEYGMLLFDINWDGVLSSAEQSRWADVRAAGASINPEFYLKEKFYFMWGTEDIGGTTWIPANSPLIVAETDGNRYYTQPHAQTYNEFGFYAPSGGDYALWADPGVFTIKYDIKLSGNISTAQHFVDPNLAKDFAVTKADIRLTTPIKANKDGWQTVVYQFDASEFVTQENESLGKLVIYTQTNESSAVANAFICYDNIQVYWKPSKVNVTLKPDTNNEVNETVVAVSTRGVLVSDLLKSVDMSDTTLNAKGIRNADGSVVLGLNDTLTALEDATYYIIWEENVWSDDELGMLIMNGNFEGEWLTTGINRWPEISTLGTSQNPDYSYEGVTGLQYTVSGTGIAFDSEGKWIPADYKKTENLNTYFEFPIGNESYNGEGYTNFNAYAMGQGASQYQYQGAGIYTVSAKVRFPEELVLKHARMSLNAYNGTGIYNVASEDYKDLEAGKWHEISATWVADASVGHGLGSTEIYFFYEPTSEKINVAVDDYKIYFKPFTAEVTLRANNNPVAKDIVLPDMPTSGFTTEELISHIRTPLGGMDLVGLAYDKAGTKMLEGDIVIGGDTRFFMIWKDSEIDPNAPVSENVNSIRTDDPVGMRFRSYMTSTVYQDATQVGWVATRLDMLEAKEINPYDFTRESDVTKVYAYNKDTDGTDKVFAADDINTYVTAVLYNIPENHYKTTLVARPFTVVDGVTYYGFPIERSICDVAEAVRDSGYSGCNNDQKTYIMSILEACNKPTEPQVTEE